MTERF